MLAEPERWTDRYLGKTVVANEGENIGNIESLYYNRLTEVPEWFVVGSGFLGRQRLVVPIAGSELADGNVRIPFSAEVVRQQPESEAGEELTSEAETLLSSYFGLGVHEEHPSGQIT